MWTTAVHKYGVKFVMQCLYEESSILYPNLLNDTFKFLYQGVKTPKTKWPKDVLLKALIYKLFEYVDHCSAYLYCFLQWEIGIHHYIISRSYIYIYFHDNGMTFTTKSQTTCLKTKWFFAKHMHLVVRYTKGFKQKHAKCLYIQISCFFQGPLIYRTLQI